MNQVIRKEMNFAVVGLMLALGLMGLYLTIKPAVLNLIFQSSPYEPMTELVGKREDGWIYGTVTMEKRNHCDPTGGPPPFFRWEWVANGKTYVSTTLPMINGRPFVPRKVVEPGIAVRIGEISSEVPRDIPDLTSSITSLVVVCDRGDGTMRPYRITPDIIVPPSDGPLAFAPL